MKRNLQSGNQTYIIKPILPVEKAHGKNQAAPHDHCPNDSGNAYITVPVYKTNEKFTKKQIKDASSMYTIHQTSSHSFVLSLKHDPSIHIAVPYYRTFETFVNGKPTVVVSNFFPTSTEQATPPPGVNVIGQTAQLLSVSSHVGTVFEDPNLDPILVSNASNNTVVKQNQAGNQSIQRKTGSTQLQSKQSVQNKEKGNDYVCPVASPNGSVEPNSKRQRVNGESETVKQSSWNKNEFNCVHVKEWKKQEHADVTVFSDHSLFKSFLNYMVENRSLKVEEIPVIFKGNESNVTKIANILASLHVIKYIVIDSIKNEGMYLFPEVGENVLIPLINDRTTFDQDQIQKEEVELARLRKRVEKLENLTSSDRMTPGLVFSALLKEDSNLLSEPLYHQLNSVPIIRDSVNNVSIQ